MYQIKGKINSNNAPAFEEEIMAVKPTEIDAAELEYISSAGLRVLMKLFKAVGDVTICNVSTEVYEIFDMTGFTSIMNIKKALREISIEGKPVLGKGGNGTVYRLDDETIVKVYSSEHALEIIDRERAYSKAAFVAGIPTAIAFDTVKVGDNYGVVYEAMNSDTLSHTIVNDREHLNEYVAQYVALAKKLHSTSITDGSFASLKDILMKRAESDFMKEHLEPSEIDVLKEIVTSIPECDTLVHGDLHPGNIMLSDGELMLIDMGEVTRGIPIYDIVSVFRDLISAPKRASDAMLMSVGLDAETCLEVGQKFLAMYSGITDPAQFEQYMNMLGLIYAFNVVMLMPEFPGAAERAPMIIQNLLRPVVIPNADKLKYIFSTQTNNTSAN